MSKLVNFVRVNFHKHPIIANGIIYGTLFFGAECSQQVITKKYMTDKPTNLDHPTLARYAFYGTMIQGPLLTVWYKYLDKWFPGTALRIVGKKLFVDQFLSVPPLLCIFYISMSIMEGKSDIFEECRTKFVQTFKNSCMFWLPVQSINFILIPSPYRVIYIGMASFAWVNILCFIKRQDY